MARHLAGRLFRANGYGLYDMTGNVCEWTTDYSSHRGAGSDETRGACSTPPRKPARHERGGL
jgi:formylglycine-generating enzyme required for sulfatase activity